MNIDNLMTPEGFRHTDYGEAIPCPWCGSLTCARLTLHGWECTATGRRVTDAMLEQSAYRHHLRRRPTAERLAETQHALARLEQHFAARQRRTGQPLTREEQDELYRLKRRIKLLLDEQAAHRESAWERIRVQG